LIEASPEKALAQKFLGFMMTPAFQDIIPTTNWMLPAGATDTALPEAFGKLVVPEKTLLFSPNEVFQNRRAWMDEWLNAMSK
jgi:thiamine transport system substrate-binding protein